MGQPDPLYRPFLGDSYNNDELALRIADTAKSQFRTWSSFFRRKTAEQATSVLVRFVICDANRLSLDNLHTVYGWVAAKTFNAGPALSDHLSVVPLVMSRLRGTTCHPGPPAGPDRPAAPAGPGIPGGPG
jgi:hypothetical protein